MSIKSQDQSIEDPTFQYSSFDFKRSEVKQSYERKKCSVLLYEHYESSQIDSLSKLRRVEVLSRDKRKRVIQ